MLTVKLYNGDESTERSFYIYGMEDYSRLQEAICMELIRLEENKKNEDKIALERLVDKAGVNDVDELEDWVTDAYEIKDALDSSDYDSVDEMTERIESLVDTLEEIRRAIEDVRCW